MGELHHVYFQNTVLQYIQAAAVFVGVVLGALILRTAALAKLKSLAARTETDLDDFAVELIGTIRAPEVYLLAFYVASRPLILPGWLDRGFRGAVIVAVTYRVLRLLQRIVGYAVGKALKPGPAGMTEADRNTQRNITYIVDALLWVVGFLFLLSNLGFNVTSMIAGLGVGGIAVALAAQAVLGDLFSAVAIFLDKPFLVGDAINVDGNVGVVERIGLKTTRLRLISGEIMIVPNSQLTSSKLRNYRDFADRRVVFEFGVMYGTPAAKLREIPVLVKTAIEAKAKTRFDRAHFTKFGESSLDFEIVYYVLGSDYALYMDTHQAILLEIAERLERLGVEFAFPTRTVHVVNAKP